MIIRLHKKVQMLVFFILISTKLVQTDHQICSQILLEQLRWYEEKTFFKPADQSEDDKVLQELWGVTGALYNKMIETTALYFTGMLMDSEQFHKQIMFEFGKHLLYASKIIAQYVPKLLNNPKISWRLKLRKSLYIASVLVVMVVWMQKYYQPSSQFHHGMAYRDNKMYAPDHENSSLDIAMSGSPRQRPQ